MGPSWLIMKKSFGCYKSWQKVKLTVAEERIVLVSRKKLDPLHMGKSFGASNFGDNWSKMKKPGKGLQKIGLNWRHWFPQRIGLFGVFESNWVGPNK